MPYINTDLSYGIFRSAGRFKGSTLYQANPIIDDIEAKPETGLRRQRVNGRILIDTSILDGGAVSYKSPDCLCLDKPSINDLAKHRWQGRTMPDANTERQLIRRIKKGDRRAFANELLPAFHHSIRSIVGKYTPKGFYSRRDTDKHTNQQLFEDLMSVGCRGLYESVLSFKPSKRCRLWTIAKTKIAGLISNEANYQRRRGMAGSSRIDRWIFSNLGATGEALLAAQRKLIKHPLYATLQEAEDALRAANDLEHSAVFSGGGDGCDIEKGWALTGEEDETVVRAAKPVEEWRDLYHSQNPSRWSPQLGDGWGVNFSIRKPVELIGKLPPNLSRYSEFRVNEGHNAVGHRRVNAIVDFWIKEFCGPYGTTRANFPPRTQGPHPLSALKAGKAYDPDHRETATVRLKTGKTKQWRRQKADGPIRRIRVTKEVNAKYVAMIQRLPPTKRKVHDVTGTQASSSSTSNVVILKTRRGGKARFQFSERHDATSPRTGLTGAWTAVRG
jgi:hypothetical protein